MSIRGGRKTIELEAVDDQKALNAYLQSVIRYMSIVNVLQARQHELLTEEVADLKAVSRWHEGA